MMRKEKNFDFLRRFAEIHQTGMRDNTQLPESDEIEITEQWQLVFPEKFSGVYRTAALDFQQYLLISLGLSLTISFEVPKELSHKIIFCIDPDISCRQQITVAADHILVKAVSDKEVFRAAIYLEDLMNLRRAPFLKQKNISRDAKYRMRSVHSGAGIDDYPDWQLSAIAHAGFDTIEFFFKDFELSSGGPRRINNIIDRAADYGLSVMFYNLKSSFKHPDDPDAEEFFDSIYGELFRRYPNAIGLTLCGESQEFPSKDPRSSGKRWSESKVDGIQENRPSVGFFPCRDYPDYIAKIRDAVHRVKPEAEIIVNTYNWGYLKPEDRKEFLDNFPKNVTLQTTYDIFKEFQRDGLQFSVMDYSIFADDPGQYFETEIRMAHERNIPVRVTSNLAGATWDLGVAPYVPAPYRWMRRMEVLDDARDRFGVDCHYENHHYGWFPNIVTDLSKWNNALPQEFSPQEILERVTIRDFGTAAAPEIMKVWRLWSDAMGHCPTSNEDQYGPWRVGPAYPFIFHPYITRTMRSREFIFPTSAHAERGGVIVETFYQPFENRNQSPGILRFRSDMPELAKMLELWEEGLRILEAAMPLVLPEKFEAAERFHSLGVFFRNSIITVIHTKEWYMLNVKLLNANNKEEINTYLDQLEKIANDEINNALNTIPAVENDSRIGWEGSMEYACDRWHLEWKVRQVKSTLQYIEDYRVMNALPQSN